MITRNFKNLIAGILQSASFVSGSLPIVGANAVQKFLTGNFNFPGSRTETFTNSETAAGISIGTGRTAAKETDFNLERTITSGISVTVTSKTAGVDSPVKPFIKYVLTVTNNSGAAITVSEIGYKQTLKGSTFPRGTSGDDIVCLLDRTVLDSPVTIEAGDAGIIEYTLETIPAEKTVNGIKIVSFTYGSDAEIATMIDAARAGTIDLQTDGGWSVGDMRAIEIAAFTGGNNVSHDAQTIDIAIASFDDYNGCGCLFQFDFIEALAKSQRMNASNTNVGGYGATEMYNTTLPALAAALPSWMTSRMKTFSVLASAGNQSDTIETVTGNKLALRSEVEIFGNHANSKDGEGSVIPLYKYGGPRTKRQGRNGSASGWWERSPCGSVSGNFCNVYGNGSATSSGASGAGGVAPFGCI